MATVCHSALQGAHVVRPLTVVSIRLRILHSPQLRYEAVLGRSSSLHHDPRRKPPLGAHIARAFSIIK